MKLKICHLFPEALNLYGDRGNVLCMKQRLLWRGIECEIDHLRIGEKKSLSDFDIFFMGGGQDFEQELLLKELSGQNGKEIVAAINDGKTFLCICGGYQILGTHYETHDGVRCNFLGVLDLYTIGGEKRLIGNYAYQITDSSEAFAASVPSAISVPAGSSNLSDRSSGPEASAGSGRHTGAADPNPERIIVGFENHSGRTYLGKGVRPLGYLICGNGNNGEDGTEGARYKNVFGTYSHGPVLPKNPYLCDLLLANALERKYGSLRLPPLEDSFEKAAHDRALGMLKSRFRIPHE